MYKRTIYPESPSPCREVWRWPPQMWFALVAAPTQCAPSPVSSLHRWCAARGTPPCVHWPSTTHGSPSILHNSPVDFTPYYLYHHVLYRRTYVEGYTLHIVQTHACLQRRTSAQTHTHTHTHTHAHTHAHTRACTHTHTHTCTHTHTHAHAHTHTHNTVHTHTHQGSCLTSSNVCLVLESDYASIC